MNSLLVIGFVWPEPNSSAAGSRMLQLIHQFQIQGYEVTFASTAKKSQNTFDLNSIGVLTKDIKLNDTSFDDFIKALNPAIVLFDRFMVEEQFGWRVAEQCPACIRILDTEDFHGLRKGREEAIKTNSTFDMTHLYNDTTKREIASIYRCDLSLIISEVEMEILLVDFKINANLLYYLPFLCEPLSKSQQDELPDFDARQNFITIGNFLHSPNYDAVVYLKKQIWPGIRKRLPKAELHIYGAYASQKVTQLHNTNEGFLIKGFAKNVDAVMQESKVCLAPLRFGAGLKGKLIDAMQNGTPAIMSTIAAEGMFGNNEANGFIEDRPEVFVKKAYELYTNKSFWLKSQQNGFYILENRFNETSFQTYFKNRILKVKGNLNTYRQQNFIGQMLQHHTLQSTKYLSKWIEEKNRS